MRPITFALQFRGVATTVGPGTLAARASAPSGALLTTLQPDGVHGGYEQAPGEEAVLHASITVARDGTFQAAGSIAFGVRHAVRFRTIGVGSLERTPDRHLRVGSVSATIEGGSGQFEAAMGRITSNFLLSDTGEITDNQIGMVFIREAREDPSDR